MGVLEWGVGGVKNRKTCSFPMEPCKEQQREDEGEEEEGLKKKDSCFVCNRHAGKDTSEDWSGMDGGGKERQR